MRPERQLHFKIVPGVGLSDVRFGLFGTDAEQVLGKPDSVRELDDGDEQYTLYSYDRLGVFLFFEHAEEHRLLTIEVDSKCPCTLYGESIFGQDVDGIKRLLESTEPGALLCPVQESQLESVDQTWLSLPGKGLTFYFGGEGMLEEISLGPVFDEDDAIVWPEKLAT